MFYFWQCFNLLSARGDADAAAAAGGASAARAAGCRVSYCSRI